MRKGRGDAGGMAVGRVRCRVTQVARRGHRLPPVVVVDAEEGAGEGHYFSVGDEYAGVNLSRRDGDEGGTKQGDAEEAE